MGPGRRYLGHWEHVFEGDCGTSQPFSLFFVQATRWAFFLYHTYLQGYAAALLVTKERPTEPKHIFALYKLTTSVVCYSSRKLTNTMFYLILLLVCWVRVHCDIYKRSYNISYLNWPPLSFFFIPTSPHS
jgi:hypothetical protein